MYPVGFRGSWRGGRALARAAADFGAELLAAHTSHAHAHALRSGLPVVVHRRVDFAPGRLSRAKYRAALGYVAVSAAVRRVLEGAGVPGSRITVVHDAVRPLDVSTDREGFRAELGWPSDAVVLLAAGALVDHKGHRWLVEAMQHLPDLHLAIAGEGRLRAGLARRARALGSRIRLLGHRDDMGRLLGSADLFVHPSVEEGMGQVLVEAQLAGLPVVATAVGGVPEVVLPPGRLVPPRDPLALARAIRELLADSGAREELALRRPLLLERHGVPTLVANTHAAYGAFLDGRPLDRPHLAG